MERGLSIKGAPDSSSSRVTLGSLGFLHPRRVAMADPEDRVGQQPAEVLVREVLRDAQRGVDDPRPTVGVSDRDRLALPTVVARLKHDHAGGQVGAAVELAADEWADAAQDRMVCAVGLVAYLHG